MKIYQRPSIKTLSMDAEAMFLAASGEPKEVIQFEGEAVNPEDAQSKVGNLGTSNSLWDE